MFCRACNTTMKSKQTHCPNCGRPASARHMAEPKTKLPLSPSTANDTGEHELDEPLARERPREFQERGADRREANRDAGRERVSGLSISRVRETLAAEPDLLEEGLRLHRDERMQPDGRYATDVGDIDLMAVDDAGALVVVMIADKDDDPVSEILPRIGWVRKHVSKTGQEVRGVVLLQSKPEDLGYAAAALAGSVSFKTYRMSLLLEDLDI